MNWTGPRTSITLLVVAAGALFGLPAAASTTESATAQTYPMPASGTLDVVGHGWGHGHGMSQYGARGAALAGWTGAEIVAWAYPHTAAGSVAGLGIRVRLSGADDGPLMVATAPGLAATDDAGRRVRLSAAYSRYRVVFSAGRPVLAAWTGARWSTAATLSGAVRIGGAAVVRVYYPRPKPDCRGGTEMLLRGTVSTRLVAGAQYSIGMLGLDDYVAGVVAPEMPASWPAAALQAQAIAARSYAAYQRGHAGRRWYDVVDTQADQCFDGVAAETARTSAAVAASAGVVRTYGGLPIFAQFSSSDGGWTAPGGQPYLVGQPDPYEAASHNPYATWTASAPATTLAAIDGPGGIEQVDQVRILARDGGGEWGGRVSRAAVDGSNALGAPMSIQLSGEELRRALHLRSTYFTFREPAGVA